METVNHEKGKFADPLTVDFVYEVACRAVEIAGEANRWVDALMMIVTVQMFMILLLSL